MPRSRRGRWTTTAADNEGAGEGGPCRPHRVDRSALKAAAELTVLASHVAALDARTATATVELTLHVVLRLAPRVTPDLVLS